MYLFCIFQSPDQQTVPRDNIRRITPTFPADIRSPFYDKSGDPTVMFIKKNTVFKIKLNLSIKWHFLETHH